MNSTDAKRMVNGQLYQAGASDLVAARKRAHALARAYSQIGTDDRQAQTKALKELFGATGKRLTVEAPLYLDYGSNITVGEDFYANFDCIMLDVAPITIGNNVMFGPRVGLYTAGHPTPADIRNAGYEYGHPITIGNNVWLGGSVSVMPGVTIGDNTVVGGGSVVVKDLPPNVIAAGNPAKVIRPIGAADVAHWQAERDDYDQEMK